MIRNLTASTTAIALLVALLVAGVLWGTSLTQQGVDRSITRNFTAAGTLAQIQVAGEQMRRFEKEAFIYVAAAERRNGYVKEFDGAYGRLLEHLDTALAASNPAFDEAERAQILRWKQAANFYVGEFYTAARRGGELAQAATTADQRGAVTLTANEAIKAGKDRFRELLTGAEKLRIVKEQGSQRIAVEMQTIFSQLRLGTLLAGLGVIGIALWILRSQSRAHAAVAAGAGPLRANRAA